MQQLLQFINNNLLLSLVWLLLLVTTLITVAKKGLSAIEVISSQEAVRLINQADAVVWDVRPQDSFNTGHIAGSQHVSAQAIEAKQLGPLAACKTRHLIVVSEDGLQAMVLAKLLYKQGFHQLSVLREGLLGWNSDRLPLASRQPAAIEIYTRPNCPYCTRAKAVLAQYGAKFKEIHIEQDERKQQEMVTRSGRTSVPQIFIRGELIGGCDDLLALDAQQGLTPLL